MNFSHLARNSSDSLPFAAGAVIFREGENGDSAFVIQEGTVELRHGESVVRVLGPGDLFGELAIIDTLPRSASAIAQSDVRLVPISQKRFLFLVQETPFFAIQVMRVLAERLRVTTGKV